MVLFLFLVSLLGRFLILVSVLLFLSTGLVVASGLVAGALVGLAAAVAVFGLSAALFCLAVFLLFLPTALLGFFPRFLSSSRNGIVCGWSFLFAYSLCLCMFFCFNSWLLSFLFRSSFCFSSSIFPWSVLRSWSRLGSCS